MALSELDRLRLSTDPELAFLRDDATAMLAVVADYEPHGHVGLERARIDQWTARAGVWLLMAGIDAPEFTTLAVQPGDLPKHPADRPGLFETFLAATAHLATPGG